MKNKKLISIVIFCYNEEENIMRAYDAVRAVLNKNTKYAYEFIFVDNGSQDKTREKITTLVHDDKRATGVILSRNFGPEASGQAGLDKARGDAIILYECDMQDPPELMLEFIRKWEQGYDVVVGVRDSIEDSFVMTFFRKSFYTLYRAWADITIPINSGSYGLVSRKAHKAIASLPEKYRFYRGLRSWVGFSTDYVHYHRRKRMYGKSSYSFFGYIKHAERSFFGFSYVPLDIMIYFGLFLTLCSFLFIVIYFLIFLLFGNPIKGAVTILVAIVFFGGVNLLALSIIGKYIQVIVEETKARPTYIVDTIVGK